jgi:hypothetical protein
MGEAKQSCNIFEKGAFQILRIHHLESSQDRELLIFKVYSKIEGIINSNLDQDIRRRPHGIYHKSPGWL